MEIKREQREILNKDYKKRSDSTVIEDYLYGNVRGSIILSSGNIRSTGNDFVFPPKKRIEKHEKLKELLANIVLP